MSLTVTPHLSKKKIPYQQCYRTDIASPRLFIVIFQIKTSLKCQKNTHDILIQLIKDKHI